MRVLFCLSLLTLAATATEPEVVSARLEWEPGFVGTITGRTIVLRPDPGPGVTVPKVRNAAYGEVTLLDEFRVRFLLTFGKSSRSLRVDTDLDGDLAEEKSHAWKKSKGKLRARDTVVLRLPGEAEPVAVDFLFRLDSEETTDRVNLYTRIHRRGFAEIGGRVRAVALVDKNTNLRFDDEQDLLWVDVDGDGILTSKQPHELSAPGKPFYAGGKGYVARVPAATGRIIEFQEVRPAPPPQPMPFETWKVPPTRPEVKPPKESLNELRRSYTAAGTKERIRILRKASQHGTPAAFNFLHEAFREEEEPLLRRWAVAEMGWGPYSRFAGRVGKIAKTHEDPQTRLMAIVALHRMEAKGRANVYAAVLSQIKSDEPREMLGAAEYLAYVGTPGSRKALLTAYRKQKDVKVRRSLYGYATHYDPQGPSPALVAAALRDSDVLLRAEAVQDLRTTDPARARPEALKLRGEPMAASALVTVLRPYGDRKAVEAVLDALEDGDEDVRAAARKMLRAVRDPGGVEAIAAGLKSESVPVRWICADVLAGVQSPAVTRALVAALSRESDDAVAGILCDTLGDHGGPRSIAALLRYAHRKKAASRGRAVAALARSGIGDESVRAFLERLLVASSWENRVLAIDALARSQDVRFIDPILRNLDHDAWQVRLAAAEALRHIRVERAVEPLIARLDVEKVARVRDAVAETLFLVTGQQFSDIAAVWRKWWADHGGSFRVPEKVPGRRPGAGTGTFYGIPVRTERVVFVLDRSSSMEARDVASKDRRSRLEAARIELLGAVARLRNSAWVNVIFFNTNVKSWQEQMVRLTSKRRSALEEYLREQEPEGRTNLYDALALALEEREVDTIFLLSDGAPNEGRYRHPDDILRAVRRLNQVRRIAIHTIAVGRSSSLLRRLAAENHGRYIRR